MMDSSKKKFQEKTTDVVAPTTSKDDVPDKQLMSCTRSMLKKTEYLLAESRKLTGGLKKTVGTKKNSKYLPRIGDQTDEKEKSSLESVKYLVHSQPTQIENDQLPPVRTSSADRFSVSVLHSNRKQPINDFDDFQKLNSKLPPKWIEKRVNDAPSLPESIVNSNEDLKLLSSTLPDEASLTRAEWENQIARHILSVYASTKALKDRHESRAILNYVDRKGEDTVESVKGYLKRDDVIGNAVAQAKKASSDVGGSALGPGVNQDSNPSLIPPLANATNMMDAGLSKSNQLQFRDTNVGSQPREAQFDQYDPAEDSANCIPTNWAAIESQWENTHEGFDFALMDSAQGTGIPPPNIRRVRTKSATSERPPSPERPVFAFRAKTTSACLTVGTSPPKERGILSKDVSDSIVEPLSPSPFLQSKFVSGVFLIANKEGEKLIVRGPPIVAPIWFVETGDIYLDWSDLPGGEKIQANLSILYEHRRFLEFVCLVRSTLKECFYEINRTDLEPIPIRAGTIVSPTRQSVVKNIVTRSHSPPREVSSAKDRFRTRLMDSGATLNIGMREQELAKCWRRLVLTANAMAVMSIEKKDFVTALSILKKAEKWAFRTDILLKNNTCQELRAYLLDSYAYYYYCQKLSMAAVDYSRRAIKIYEKLGHVEGAAIGLLHISACECQLGKFKASHKTLFQFLAMVEDGRLGLESASAKQLCSVAVAYHNLAAVQMKLQVSDLACKSSQNARKIARLCLSVSNRWLPIFQRTHELCLEDVRFRLSQRTDIDDFQKKTIIELATDLYDPAPDV